MEPQLKTAPMLQRMMYLAFGPRKVFESLEASEAIASEDPSESGRDFHNDAESRKWPELVYKI